jgi:putative addiction module component (TIGR02574 family)
MGDALRISMTLKQVQKSALKLPLPSRVKLMTALAKSFEVETLHICPPGVLSDADPNFMEILHSRLDAYERGEVKTIPWEKVKKRLFRRRT